MTKNSSLQLVDKSLRTDADIISETLVALYTSDTLTKAAEKLNLTRQAVYDRIEKYGLKKHIDRMAQEALDILRMSSVKAAENFANKIEHRDADVSMQASKEILDRVGITPKQDNRTTVNVGLGVSFIENVASETPSQTDGGSEGQSQVSGDMRGEEIREVSPQPNDNPEMGQ